MIDDGPTQHPDETNDFGRYGPGCRPTGGGALYAVILALVERPCAVGSGDDLDSWAISAFERGIEVLDEAGFVAIDPAAGRTVGKLLPKARKFKAWMKIHDRGKRLATTPGSTGSIGVGSTEP